MLRRAAILLMIGAFLAASASPAYARPWWKRRIDRLVSGRSIGVAITEGDHRLYFHRSKKRMVPASNQKLLMSMALFDLVGRKTRFPTKLTGPPAVGGVITGNVWIHGRGDPTVAGTGRYVNSLPIKATRLGRLARALKAAGVTRIDGRIKGSKTYFKHDWFAPGWRSYFPGTYVALPSALTIDGNRVDGRATSNPEWHAAKSLTSKLKARGVRVTGSPGAGRAPSGGTTLAEIRSPPAGALARYMNRKSSNFFAEVLGKKLGAEVLGRPGTIAKGAAATKRWAAAHGVAIASSDSSGLSYSNRVSPRGMVRLLAAAEAEPWGPSLRDTLARPGTGTLEGRLSGVPVRAKTGTLSSISSLSGWVQLEKTGTWAEFSILSRGMSKSTATRIENKIVALAHRHGRVATRRSSSGKQESSTTLATDPGRFDDEAGLLWIGADGRTHGVTASPRRPRRGGVEQNAGQGRDARGGGSFARVVAR